MKMKVFKKMARETSEPTAFKELDSVFVALPFCLYFIILHSGLDSPLLTFVFRETYGRGRQVKPNNIYIYIYVYIYILICIAAMKETVNNKKNNNDYRTFCLTKKRAGP